MIINKRKNKYMLELALDELLDIKEALAVRIYAAQEYSKGEFTVPPYMPNHKRLLEHINWWIYGERNEQ